VEDKVKPKKSYTVKVTAAGVLFPPQFQAAVLAMQRYRVRKPEAKPAEVQLVLEYGSDGE